MARYVYLDKAERDPKSVLTVGTFDGVHEGHRSIIDLVVARAMETGGRSVVVTFDPHPREVINAGDNPVKLLTSLDERAEILGEIGVDLMVVIPFSRDFSLLSSEEFIRDVIHAKIGVAEFIIGYDHQFGRNREGTIETVTKLGRELGFRSEVVQAHAIEKTTVSSTQVRKALAEKGDIELAAKFLGRPYRLTGTVVHGQKRGKSIGFPTANIRVENPRKIIPLNGVYKVGVSIDGVDYTGMMNIGTRPTFEGMDQSIEVHIFDFQEEIYGRSITVSFLKRLRDEKKFESVDELVAQLKKDKQDCLSA